MRSIKQFDDATIEQLFGADDAENERDDRFREYFYFNKIFENINNELPIRILVGHKGIGKSALLRRAYLSDLENGRPAVRLQPGDLLQVKVDASTSELDFLAEKWKMGLLSSIAEKAVSDLAKHSVNTEELKGISNKVGSFLDILTSILIKKMSGLVPGVDGAIAETLSKQKGITVYIDDIDRGWSASERDIKNISALLTAVRDITGSDQRIRFRIGLRTDAYFLVRTSDETTDKIERNVVWLTWTHHEVLCLVAKRITTFFGDDISQEQISRMTQIQISDKIFARVIDSRFQGNGHWSNRPIHNVLTSLSRRRPRDMIKLLHGASRKAFAANHTQISSRDLESSFEGYSGERVQDVINEFRSELANIERLVFGFTPSRKGRRTSESFLFTNDALASKLRNIMQNAPLQFSNRRPVNPRSLIQFLYKIEFIAARRDGDNGIERKHFDQNRFLASEVAEFGYDWEIHPAFRWALQPHSVHKILDDIRP